MTDHGEVSASVDYANRQYITKEGIRLTLKPLSRLVLERLYNNTDGKPKIPIIEVTIGGQFKRMEQNPEDPDYKTALDEWQSERNIGLARYLFVHGIVEDPPETFTNEYRSYSPNMGDYDIKYLWIVSLLGATDEEQMTGMKDLSEALTGQTMPTEKGMREAEESFRSNGGGTSGDAVPDGSVNPTGDVLPEDGRNASVG